MYQLFCGWFDNTVITVKPAGIAWRRKKLMFGLNVNFHFGIRAIIVMGHNVDCSRQQIKISMMTCVINICHVVALCGLTPVVVDNAKKSELSRIRIAKAWMISVQLTYTVAAWWCTCSCWRCWGCLWGSPSPRWTPPPSSPSGSLQSCRHRQT